MRKYEFKDNWLITVYCYVSILNIKNCMKRWTTKKKDNKSNIAALLSENTLVASQPSHVKSESRGAIMKLDDYSYKQSVVPSRSTSRKQRTYDRADTNIITNGPSIESNVMNHLL